MLAIICFDLIPESMKFSNIFNVLMGIILGVFAMIVCDIFVKTKLNSNLIRNDTNSLLKTGIIFLKVLL